MILRIIVCCCLLLSTRCMKAPLPKEPTCLTGHMTEVQDWVDAKGILIHHDDSAIDLSSSVNPFPQLQLLVSHRSSTRVKYLSMARCKLTEVPTMVFRTPNGTQISEALQYLTLYGNNFSDAAPLETYEATINATQPWERTVDTYLNKPTIITWSRGIKETEFPNLKELDLRACSIQVLDNNIFQGMPKLEALYIGENRINYIYGNAFAGLRNLVHLDFSYNDPCDDAGHDLPLVLESTATYGHLKKLASFDLSRTRLTQRHMFTLYYLPRTLSRLSLCDTGLTNLHQKIFQNTSLKILDLSGNEGILNINQSLAGIENTLQILYAMNTGLRTMDIFKNFEKLEVLDVSLNEISVLEQNVSKSLKNLQILNLEMNRFISWFSPTFSYMKSLKLLTLKDNNINIITSAMINDISDVEYITMSRNFIVCNCHSRDFINYALRNEGIKNPGIITENNRGNMKIDKEIPAVTYHRAFEDNNWKIVNRVQINKNCTDCDDLSDEIEANFLLLDYYPGAYTCLYVPDSKSIEFFEVGACNKQARIDYDTVMQDGRNKLYLLFTIPVFLSILILIYVFRRHLRYFIITVKNSALLSLVHKSEFVDDTTIFHYDVFVSYCNEDRAWVLDQLLPHLESDCNISACLHERDFQVGSSILENIVSCMDRSRSIMLIISQRFLLSQWCQFEMHLAQHRLLETRREDLTLVLLEEIPRRMRPTTLHYLMLTKTYIVWPGSESERKLFWRRLKKTLVTLKQKQSALEGVSLA